MGPGAGLDPFGEFRLTAIRSPGRQPFSESLYRLSYPSPLLTEGVVQCLYSLGSEEEGNTFVPNVGAKTHPTWLREIS